MGKPMPTEMVKLREGLDERGIEWFDYSEELGLPFFYDTYSSGGYSGIYRTIWEYKGSRFSAICGFGTYGRELDLLELMIDSNEPVGYLGAANILADIDGETFLKVVRK